MKSYYTIMVRKACDYQHILKDTKELITRFNTQPKKIEINKTIELSADEFEIFKNNLLNNHEFGEGIDQSEFSVLLVKAENTSDKSGIIINPSGSLYARYSGLIVEETEMFQCSNCGGKFIGHPAISRIDNKSLVCSECSLFEALNDYELAKCLQDFQKRATLFNITLNVQIPNGDEVIIRPSSNN